MKQNIPFLISNCLWCIVLHRTKSQSSMTSWQVVCSFKKQLTLKTKSYSNYLLRIMIFQRAIVEIRNCYRSSFTKIAKKHFEILSWVYKDIQWSNKKKDYDWSDLDLFIDMFVHLAVNQIIVDWNWWHTH